MSHSNRDELRRKHSSVDLQQQVTHLDVYNRPMESAGKCWKVLESAGKCSTAFGVVHEAAVAITRNGNFYMIEKGVEKSDDINYSVRYREGECRIVQVTPKDFRDWRLVRSVKKVNYGVTLEDLFDSCGSGYSCVADNCWNGTQRMRVRANKAEDGPTWQEMVAIGGAVAVGAGALIYGFGCLVYRAVWEKD